MSNEIDDVTNWEDDIEKAREEMKELDDSEFWSAPEYSMPENEEPEVKEEDVPEGFDELDVDDDVLAKVFEEENEEIKNIVDNVPDLSEFLTHTIDDVNILSKTLDEKVDMPSDTLSAILDDEKEHLTKLAKIVVNYTKRDELENRQIAKCLNSLKHLDEVLPDKITSGTKLEPNKTTVFSGQDAMINIAAKIHGLRKTHLIHSGFHIVTKKLSSSEIREILRYIDDEGNEIGKVLGMHYYTVDDVVFVQKFSEILKFIVVDSNLKDWQRGTTLVECISYLDFDVIIASICSQLYRQGVKHEMVCPEIDCKYSEVINLDINKIKLIDTSRLTEKATQILLSGKPFDKIKCKAYQKEIKAYKEVEVLPNVTFTLRVPSITTFVRYGIEYIAKLIQALYSDNKTPEQKDIARYRIVNYYKMFLPWIEKVSIFVPETQSTMVVRDRAGFEQLLEKDVWANNKNLKEFVSFFSEAKMVHYGFLGQQCPSCNKVPNPKTNGFVPLDIRSFFFNLLTYQNRKDMKP